MLNTTLDGITKIAHNAQYAEQGSALPLADESRPKLWDDMNDDEKVASRARAKSIVESDVTHAQLAAWAAEKRDQTGYGQGDFSVGDVAFQSVCIDLVRSTAPEVHKMIDRAQGMAMLAALRGPQAPMGAQPPGAMPPGGPQPPQMPPGASAMPPGGMPGAQPGMGAPQQGAMPPPQQGMQQPPPGALQPAQPQSPLQARRLATILRGSAQPSRPVSQVPQMM